MADDLREKIAEVLAGHARPYTGSQSCECGVVFRWTGYDSETVWAHRRHVAEAILAAIGDVEIIRSIQGEDSDGPWIEYIPEAYPWPLRRLRIGRFVAERITTAWRPVDTADPRRELTEETK